MSYQSEKCKYNPIGEQCLFSIDLTPIGTDCNLTRFNQSKKCKYNRIEENFFFR